ncbi:hypothetical protein WJX77_009557 [Trebouxia sp. C0004]
MGALLLLTGGAHSRPYDQVSSSGGTATGGARDFHPNQIARPDEGLLMHCNVTGPCVIGRTAGQTSGSSLRQRQDIQCVLVAPEAPVRSQVSLVAFYKLSQASLPPVWTRSLHEELLALRGQKDTKQEIDECDAGIRLGADVSRRQVCMPTQNVRDRLVKVDGLIQSWTAAVQDAQVQDTNSARDEKDSTNYKITASSLLAYERDNNRVLGKKNAELEGTLAAAAGIIREHEKKLSSHGLHSRTRHASQPPVQQQQHEHSDSGSQ